MSSVHASEDMYEAGFQGGTRHATVDLVSQYRRQHHVDTTPSEGPTEQHPLGSAHCTTAQHDTRQDWKHSRPGAGTAKGPTGISEEASLALTSVQGEPIMYDVDDGTSDSHTLQPSLSLASMMSRTFNENDPFQVYDESLLVLGEVEDLIRAELSMAPGDPLGDQTELELARVPASLLDALQGTIEIVLESRSEIDEIMSCTSSQTSYQSQRSRMPHGSPYLKGQGGRNAHSPAATSWHSSHIRVSSAHKNSNVSPNRLMATAQQQPGPGHRQHSGRSRTHAANPTGHSNSASCTSSSPAHRSGSRPCSATIGPSSPAKLIARAADTTHMQHTPTHKMATLYEPDAASDSLAEPSEGSFQASRPQAHRPASGRRDGGQLVSAVTKAAAGALSGSPSQHSVASAGSSYLHQRMQAKRIEGEAAKEAAQDAQRAKRSGIDNTPYPEFIAKQQLRQAEAERKRIAQMRADLQFIQQLREKQAAAEISHQQALQQAEAAVAALQTHKQHTQLTQKWISYQQSLANAQL